MNNLRDLYERFKEAVNQQHWLCVAGIAGELLVMIRNTFCPDHNTPPGPVVFSASGSFSIDNPSELPDDVLWSKMDECVDKCCEVPVSAGNENANNPWAALLISLLTEAIRRWVIGR